MSVAPVAPDLIEPVVGFRKWRLDAERLSSPYVRVHWREREMHARCHRRSFVGALVEHRTLEEEHEAPHPLCKCGIYAYYRPRSRPRTIYVRLVWGVVTVWGRIEAHGAGMRAQHARVEALASSPDWPRSHQRAVRRIAGDLGIDLLHHAELEQAAGEYGGLLPESLQP